MKTHLVLMSGLLYALLANAAESTKVVTADQISVYKVPLVCPAAPQIGCGSASKPILLDLELQPGVLKAWLNRAGTIIAVVWKPDANAEARGHVAADLKEDHATEMQGTSRDEAVKNFLSGKGWYRGTDVDQLSREEAGIIAARMVRRVQAKTALATDKAEGLQRALTRMFWDRFTNDAGEKTEPVRLKDVAVKYLDQEQLEILSEAIKKGVRPLPNED